MNTYIQTKTAQYLSAASIGRTVSLAVFSLLFLTAANVSIFGQLDSSFNPNIGNSPDYSVEAIAIQPDGKIVIGGVFTTVGGVARSNFARINSDGTLDTSFNLTTGWIRDIVLQPSGKILIVGRFSSIPVSPTQSLPRPGLALINSNGTLDTSFDSSYNSTTGNGVTSTLTSDISDVALQPDGKILIAGAFYYYINYPTSNTVYLGLARLNSDGTIDTTFTPPFNTSTSNAFASVVTLQPDGKILVGGQFKTATGVTRHGLARLNSNGTLDTTFNSPLTAPDNSNNDVRSITLQPDGKILVGGNFAINGAPSTISTHLLRLNTNGTIDSTFNPNINNFINTPVNTIAVQPNGKILIGGNFIYPDGQQSFTGFQRLNANGTNDTSFNPNANHYASDIVLQPDGRILVGGSFTQIGGQPRNRLARFSGEPIITRRPGFDYDGDGKADLSVFRPGTGSWFISNSSNNAFTGVQFGATGDLIAPADFDGDGRTDISVFRPSDGGWYRLNSSNNTFSAFQFGTNGDLPVPGDFDGDGKADLTVFRPSAGSWYRINSSNNQFVAAQFGSNGDKPLVGDFDGDGKSDLTVFRPSNGTWYRINSSNDTFSPNQFGAPGDLPVAADYDGDGKTDLAVYRPSVGDWYIVNSSNSAFVSARFGVAEDKPAPADFDGDGKSDLIVFRPSSGTWYLLRTTAGFTGIQFGASGDVPTPNAFVR